MVESRGTSLACAVGLLYVWAVFAFGIRTWTKYRAKRWNIDDYTYTAAFIFAIVHAILVVNCVAHGYGRHVEDISEPDWEQIELLHYVGQFLYALSFGLDRISSALFVSIVAQASPLVWPARTVAALSGIWSIASVLCLGFDGNVGKPWTGIVTRPLFFRWLGIESIGMLLELSLFVLSTSLILRLQMATSRRLYLVAAFGIRLSLIPIIAARLVYLQPSHNPMPTWSAITPALLTESALSLSIMTGLATALPSFLAAFHPTYVVESGRLSKSTQRARNGGSGGDLYYRLDHLRSGSYSRRCSRTKAAAAATRASECRVSARIGPRVSTPDIEWKPYQGFAEGSAATAYPPRVHISSTHDRSLERSRSRSKTRGSSLVTDVRDATAAETEPQPMTIRRTTEVSIEYT